VTFLLEGIVGLLAAVGPLASPFSQLGERYLMDATCALKQ
jgi:hypothetical protein